VGMVAVATVVAATAVEGMAAVATAAGMAVADSEVEASVPC
jgi:hypothetical protein